MKILLKSAAIAGLLLAGTAQPAFAQAAPAANTGPLVPGLGVANIEAVVANSNAAKSAQTQRISQYKAQFDAAEARRKAITTQLQPLVDKYNRDSQVPSPNQASLQQQGQVIQGLQQSGEQELRKILAPVAMSEAYVNEQIGDRLDQAVKNAMAKGKISILLNPQAIAALNNNAYNLTPSILNELNLLIPAAQVVPPQGWEPREMREARAQQAQQQGAAPAAAGAKPATPAPSGR